MLLILCDVHRARTIEQTLAAYDVATVVVSDLASARSFLRRTPQAIDAVLLESELPDGHGEELLGEIEALPNQPGIVMFSDPLHGVPAEAASYRIAWASRGAPAPALAATLRLAARGFAHNTLNRFARHFRLTHREVEVLDRVANGISPKRIAVDLGVSAQGIYACLSRVSSKAGCTNYQEVVAKLFRFSCHGLGHELEK